MDIKSIDALGRGPFNKYLPTVTGITSSSDLMVAVAKLHSLNVHLCHRVCDLVQSIDGYLLLLAWKNESIIFLGAILISLAIAVGPFFVLVQRSG